MQPSIEKMSMEEMFMQFIQTQQQQMHSQQTSNKNLENQLGQLASALNNRQSGRLSSDTQVLRMEEGKGKRIIGPLRASKAKSG